MQYVASHYRFYWAGAAPFTVGLALIARDAIARRGGPERASPVSFREWSTAIQITALIAVFGMFAMPMWNHNLSSAGEVAVLIVSSILATLIIVAGHVLLAILMRPARADERDAAVARLSYRNAYFTLTIGVWCAGWLVIAHASQSLLFCTLMGIFWICEIVRLGSQLIYYRTGA